MQGQVSSCAGPRRAARRSRRPGPRPWRGRRNGRRRRAGADCQVAAEADWLEGAAASVQVVPPPPRHHVRGAVAAFLGDCRLRRPRGRDLEMDQPAGPHLRSDDRCLDRPAVRSARQAGRRIAGRPGFPRRNCHGTGDRPGTAAPKCSGGVPPGSSRFTPASAARRSCGHVPAVRRRSTRPSWRRGPRPRVRAVRPPATLTQPRKTGWWRVRTERGRSRAPEPEKRRGKGTRRTTDRRGRRAPEVLVQALTRAVRALAQELKVNPEPTPNRTRVDWHSRTEPDERHGCPKPGPRDHVWRSAP